MKNFIIFLSLILISTVNLFSQNLFLNGDFQDPNTLDNYDASAPNGCGSDGVMDCPSPLIELPYFAGYACSPGFPRVIGWDPVENHVGWANPYFVCAGEENVVGQCAPGVIVNRCNRHGYINTLPAAATGITVDENQFVGLRTYLEPPASFPNAKDMRAYLTAEFTSPLVAGQTYCLSFYMMLASRSGFTTEGIHWKFSNSTLSIPPTGSNMLHQKSLALNANNQGGANDPTDGNYTIRVTDQDNWTLITATYTAVGGEQYFTIGNFLKDIDVAPLVNPNAVGIPNNYCYYFFDNFSLTPIDNINLAWTNPSCGVDDGTITIDDLIPNQNYAITYDFNGVSVGPATMTSNASGEAIITGLAPGSYTNFLVENGACPLTDSTIIDLTVNSPTFNIVVSNPSFCNGADGTISIDSLLPNTSYTISYDANGNPVAPSTILSDNNGSILIQTLSAGNYSNFTIDLNGCVSNDSTVYSLVDPAAPFFIITPVDPSSCSGQDGQIIIDSLLPNTDYLIGYVDDGITIVPVTMTTNNAGQITIPNLDAGDYTSISVDLNGCSTVDNTIFTLSDPLPPVFNITFTDPTCGNIDGIITLSGLLQNTSYDVSYSIDNQPLISTTLTSNGSGELILTGLDGGSYDAFSVTINNCTTNDILGPYILTNPIIPVYNVSSVSPSDCNVSDGQLLFTGLLPNTSYSLTYEFNSTPSAVINFTSDLNGDFSILNLQEGTYSAISVDMNGCSTVDPGDYILINPPSPSFIVTGLDPTKCGFDDGKVTITGLDPTTIYTISYSYNSATIDLVNISTDANGEVIISNLSEGVYSDFSVSLGNCETTISEAVVLDSPDITPLNLGIDEGICNDTLHLYAGVYDSYLWQDGSTNATYVVQNVGYYSVEVSQGACTLSDDIVIFEDCPHTMFIPNSFSPDGNEFNNTFMAYGDNIKSFHMSIFNRWGEVIFESYDLNYGWDGTYNGKMSTDGEYTYKVTYTYFSNYGEEFTKDIVGHVNLIK